MSKSTKEKAEMLIKSGCGASEVAKIVGESKHTVASWKRREGWETTTALGRVEDKIAQKLLLLLDVEEPSQKQASQIDRLFGYLKPLPNHPKNNHVNDNKTAIAQSDVEIIRSKKGRPKNDEKNLITEEDIEVLVEAFNKDMFQYQKEWWHASNYDGRIILKSRQIGATYYFAQEALITALTTTKNQIFVSASKKQAAQFKRYIVAFIKKNTGKDIKGDPIRLILPHTERGEAYLYFLGTQVSSVQGYSGDLYGDECGWVRNFDSIMEVASGMALQAKYRETYFTTPSTMDHDFYKFWTGKSYNKDRAKEDHININVTHNKLKNGELNGDGYWRQIVTIEDAIEKGCNLFDLEKVKRKYSPARYAMLCMCQFTDHTASVFSFKDLQAAMFDSLEKWSDFQILKNRPLGDLPCWIGYDPSSGEEGSDSAAFVVVAPPSTSHPKYRIVEVIRTDDADYAQQFETVQLLLKKYNITYIGIDNQGEGAGVYQMVERIFPMAEAIRYNPENKAQMVTKAQTLFKRKLIEIDDVYLDDFLPSMLAIQRTLTQTGIPTYSAKRSSETHHADVAWAFLHTMNNIEFDQLIESTNNSGDNKESALMIF